MSKSKNTSLAKETEDFLGEGIKYQRLVDDRRSPRLSSKSQPQYYEKETKMTTTTTTTRIIKHKPVVQQKPLQQSAEKIILETVVTKNIYEMNPVELYDAISHKLKGQDETIHKLVAIIYPFNKMVKKEGDTNPLILPILLSGVSGTGKTETVNILKYLYQTYGDRYIKFSLTKITDETQVNQILGAGPGLEGFGNGENIPEKLLRAIGRPSIKRREDESEKTFAGRKLKEGEEFDKRHATPPKTIILHFDELNQAHHEFLKLFLSFFDDGTLSASDGSTFVLPDETRIIVIFTANYAEEAILNLSPHHHFQEACLAIENAMEEGKITKASIGRFCGNILPYFKLPEEIVRAIKREKLLEALVSVDNSYGEYISGIRYGEDELVAIEAMMPQSNDAMGMRSIKASVTRFMNDLYYDLVSYVIRFMPGVPLPLDLDFSYHLYDVWQYEELCLFMKLPDCHAIIKPCIMEKMKEKMDNHADVGLLMVRYNKRIIHAVMVDSLNQNQLQLYENPSPPLRQQQHKENDVNLIVNIRKNRKTNNYEISAYDHPTGVMSIDFGFRNLLELVKK